MARHSLFLCAAVLAGPAAAADFATARDLVERCSVELASMPASQTDQPARPEDKAASHRCRTFLQGYFRSVLAPADAGIGANAGAVLEQRRCIRLPDFISYRDLAQILIDHSKNKPELLDGPPEKLADAAYETRFPCRQH